MSSNQTPMSSNHLKRSSDEISDASHRTNQNQATTSEQAQQYVKAEMRGCVFGNHPQFIETMFDKVTDKDCVAILGALRRDGLWASSPTNLEDGQWTELPQDPVDEKSLYEPLVDILNAITEVQYERANTPRGMKLIWKDVHSHAPGSLLKGTSTKTRPDIIAQYEPEAEEGSEHSFAEQPSQTAQNLRSWWYRLVIIIELKKNYPIGGTTTLTQLLQYTRQAFKEQPFRRFFFGCTFHRTNITFWYCDRAGAIGSCMIEMHEDPLLFIRCIASFAAMDPVEHGYDPTMLAYNKDTKSTYSPWNIPPPLLETRATKRQTLPTGQWVVDMPAHYASGETAQRESFVLFAGLSMNRAEVIKGRAGRIWLARKRVDIEDEKKKPKECPIYVFKDNWHDIRRTTEGEHYKAQGRIDGVAKLYSYEQVHVDSVVDSTKAGRRGLDHTKAKSMKLEKVIEPKDTEVKTYFDDCMQRHSNASTMKYEDLLKWIEVHKWEKMMRPVYDREHHRLLLCSYGHPITEFVSRVELVIVFKDAVNGHWGLVLKKYLHRDVSRGNVVISDAESPNKGLLIDQDYTIKDFEVHLATADDTRTGTPAFMAVEMLDGKPMFRRAEVELEDGSSDDELEDGSSDDDETEEESSDTESTPTLATESPQSSQTSSSSSESYSSLLTIKHAPIHDLESFFWLLCWICLTREGPSTSRQRKPKSSTSDRNLARIIEEVFDQQDFQKLATKKRDLFSSNALFRKEILQNFAPYFAPFKRLVTRLYNILKSAYETREYDGLHEKFIAVFKKFEKSFKSAKFKKVRNEDAMVKRAKRRRALHTYIVDEGLEIDEDNDSQEEHDLYELPPLGEPETPIPNKKRRHRK
ncbi:hypothetical protein C8Q75DRAFT_754229 [Abortiporus biennis]|nr:hypothetical protein C8Q75DRAFT_754229 [Abortiporus biennis]